MKWPETMPDLDESDFVYGQWCLSEADDSDPNHATASPRILHKCETRCCLVGWVRHAFGLPACPRPDLPKAGQVFLKALCENMGRPLHAFQWRHPHEYQLQMAASDAFEGAASVPWGPVTPKEAARAWAKTLKQFDFVEDAEWFV